MFELGTLASLPRPRANSSKAVDYFANYAYFADDGDYDLLENVTTRGDGRGH